RITLFVIRPPPRSTLFPYTTLFRSVQKRARSEARTAPRWYLRLTLAADAADEDVAAVVDGDPHAGMLGRLALEEAVVGIMPGQDAALEVVEDEVAHAGLDGEDCMAVAVGLAHDGDQQVRRWNAGLHQEATLLKDIVLAVANSVDRIGPVLLDAPDLVVGARRDHGVHEVVDLDDLGPQFAGEFHRACLAQALALLWRALAELVVANRLGGQAARLHEGLRGVRCSGGETCNRHEESCQQLVGCFPHLRLPC